MLVVILALLLLLLASAWPRRCPPLGKITSFAGVQPIEVVKDRKSIAQGLMHRKTVEGGMLFVHPREGRHSYWMKNTSIPLNIDFYDRNKKFLGRREGVPFSETSLSVPGKTCYVLETERKKKSEVEVLI